MDTVAITGVAGFLGSHLADRFLAEGYRVVGIDNLLGGYRDNVPEGVEFHALDLAGNYHQLEAPLRGADLVIHAACTAYEGLSVFSPSLVSLNTYQATANTVTAAIKAGARRFVYLSSMARYGDHQGRIFREFNDPKPQDPYGISKLASELLVQNLCETHSMEWVILVPHNIIGPRQKYDDPFRNVASIMTNRMLQGKQPIIYGDGTQQRCFSFVDDVVDPLYEAATSDKALSRVINIGPDEEPVTINQLAEKLANLLGFQLDPIYMAGRPQEVPLALCSSDLARELLGYQTSTDLDDGLAHLVNWIADKGPKPFDYHLPIEIVSGLTPKSWAERLM